MPTIRNEEASFAVFRPPARSHEEFFTSHLVSPLPQDVDDESCCICRCSYGTEVEPLRVSGTSGCRHIFCATCIHTITTTPVLGNQSRCPICRQIWTTGGQRINDEESVGRFTRVRTSSLPGTTVANHAREALSIAWQLLFLQESVTRVERLRVLHIAGMVQDPQSPRTRAALDNFDRNQRRYDLEVRSIENAIEELYRQEGHLPRQFQRSSSFRNPDAGSRQAQRSSRQPSNMQGADNTAGNGPARSSEDVWDTLRRELRLSWGDLDRAVQVMGALPRSDARGLPYHHASSQPVQDEMTLRGYLRDLQIRNNSTINPRNNTRSIRTIHSAPPRNQRGTSRHRDASTQTYEIEFLQEARNVPQHMPALVASEREDLSRWVNSEQDLGGVSSGNNSVVDTRVQQGRRRGRGSSFGQDEGDNRPARRRCRCRDSIPEHARRS